MWFYRNPCKSCRNFRHLEWDHGMSSPRQLYKKWNLYGVFQKWRQENGLPKKGWQRDDQLLSTRCTSFPQGTRDGTMLPVRNAGSFACRRMLHRWRKKLQQITTDRAKTLILWLILWKNKKKLLRSHTTISQVADRPLPAPVLRNLRRNCWSCCAGGTFWCCFSMYNSSLKLQLMGGCNWSQCPPRIDLTLQ